MTFPWHFVGAAEVFSMHQGAIARYGGPANVAAKDGCVDGCIGNAQTAALYEASEGVPPDLLAAVAYLLVYLARNHCFSDGNKRIAWMATIRCFESNGFKIQATEDEAVALVLGVATGEIDADRVKSWLTSRIVGVDDAS